MGEYLDFLNGEDQLQLAVEWAHTFDVNRLQHVALQRIRTAASADAEFQAVISKLDVQTVELAKIRAAQRDGLNARTSIDDLPDPLLVDT